MTQISLAVKASDRTGQAVTCTFAATADGVALSTKDDTDPLFTIPDGARTVQVKVKPRRPVYWEETFSFSIAADGTVAADGALRARVQLAHVVNNPFTRLVMANVKVSRFRDITAHAMDLLNQPPKKRHVFNLKTTNWEDVDWDQVRYQKLMYGAWPPPDWGLHGVPGAHFLDIAEPLKSGQLNFFQDTSTADLDVDSVVLERAGVRMVPQYFAVTWPKAIAPKANAAPTPFFIYFRQLNKNNGYELSGIFGSGQAPYPENFDYVDTGMYESLHFSRTPLINPNGKGVPYQAVKAGVNVVTVMPCNSLQGEYADLNDPEDAETVLQEMQAFMFWRGGVATAPSTIGKTAIAAFSSANFFVDSWLKDDTKRRGHFLSRVVSAIYYLDPMRSYVAGGKTVQVLDGFIANALKWAAEGTDKRIRLYMQFPWPSLKKLMDKPLPAPPFIVSSSDFQRTRTVSVVTNATWSKAFRRPIKWVFVHHAIPATMLSHALAQGDFQP